MSRPKWADRIIEAWLDAHPCVCGQPADYGYTKTPGAPTWSQLRTGHAGDETTTVLEDDFTATCRTCRPVKGRRPGGANGQTVKQAAQARIDEYATTQTCAVTICDNPATVFVSPAGYPSQGQLTAGDQHARLAETLDAATWYCARHRRQVTGRDGAYALHLRRARDAADATTTAAAPPAEAAATAAGDGVVTYRFEGSVYFLAAPWTADRVAVAVRDSFGWNEAIERILGRRRGGSDIKKLRAAVAYYTAHDPGFPQPTWR